MQTPYDDIVKELRTEAELYHRDAEQEGRLNALADRLERLTRNEREDAQPAEHIELSTESVADDQRCFHMLTSGEFSSPPVSRQDLMEQAGWLMDKACTWDILGNVIFIEDGRFYVANIETLIGEANPAWLKGELADILEEMEEDDPAFALCQAKYKELEDV